MLAHAWSSVGAGWRVAAVLTGCIALVGTRSTDVPLASGLAVAIVVLAAIVDVECRRLPNRIVLLAAGAFAALTIIDAAGGSNPELAEPAVGALLLAAPLLAMHLVSPAAMGLGDVKAAVVLGAAVGAVDWQLPLSALALAAGSTATVGVLRRMRVVPFGPGLVFACAVALAGHSVILPAPGPAPEISPRAGASPAASMTTDPLHTGGPR